MHGSTLSRQGAASAKWAAAYLLVSAVAFAATGHVTLVVTHLVLLGVLGWATYARTAAAEVVFDLGASLGAGIGPFREDQFDDVARHEADNQERHEDD